VVILVVVELLEEVMRNGWEVLLILNKLFEGLRYANFHLVEIHLDSIVLVQAITPRPNGGGSLQGRFFAEKIRRLLDLEWEMVVHHSYREANQCANALANLDCSIVSN
jgi:ribonuclease HI